VFNQGSGNNRQAVTPESIGRQLQIVQASAGVEVILLWSLFQTDEDDRDAERVDIAEFVRAVDALPWPGCT
jgi:hypothetical protein